MPRRSDAAEARSTTPLACPLTWPSSPSFRTTAVSLLIADLTSFAPGISVAGDAIKDCAGKGAFGRPQGGGCGREFLTPRMPVARDQQNRIVVARQGQHPRVEPHHAEIDDDGRIMARDFVASLQ